MNRVQRTILGEPQAKAGVGETPVAGLPGVGVHITQELCITGTGWAWEN
jgi:hypothetical protein